MGITRLITVAIVIWLIWFVFKRFQQGVDNRKRNAEIKKNKAKNAVSSVKKCAACGVHVLEVEALEQDGRYYCSVEHKHSYLNDK